MSTGSAELRCLLFLASACLVAGHDIITTKITWSREVSRIIYKRCAFCHREGGAAFSLMNYSEARPWAKAIKEEVLARRMPPWQAVKGFGAFKDDRGLTGEEIELISNWVEGGAPEGDPKYLPAASKPIDWIDPVVPADTFAIDVSPHSKLDAAARMIGIRVKTLAAGASVQAIAVQPNGTIEPLLWIYQYNPKFQRTYYYKLPFDLQAGTKIEMSPEGGSLTLYILKPKPNSSR